MLDVRIVKVASVVPVTKDSRVMDSSAQVGLYTYFKFDLRNLIVVI